MTCFRVEASTACKEVSEAVGKPEDWEDGDWEGSIIVFPEELIVSRIVRDDTLTEEKICEGTMFLVECVTDEGGRSTFKVQGHVAAGSPDEVLTKIEEFEIVLITGD